MKKSRKTVKADRQTDTGFVTAVFVAFVIFLALLWVLELSKPLPAATEESKLSASQTQNIRTIVRVYGTSNVQTKVNVIDEPVPTDMPPLP